MASGKLPPFVPSRPRPLSADGRNEEALIASLRRPPVTAPVVDARVVALDGVPVFAEPWNDLNADEPAAQPAAATMGCK